MLVLSRKNNECVVLGGANGLDAAVKVTVLAIDRGQVKLGFEAQKDVSVHREEIWERMRAKDRLGRPNGGRAMPTGELDRWEDDGGGASH